MNIQSHRFATLASTARICNCGDQ